MIDALRQLSFIVLMLFVLGGGPAQAQVVGPTPASVVNDYGEAERGHGLTPRQVEEGWIALFDGRTDFGWSGGRVEEGKLCGGKNSLLLGSGDLIVHVAKGGKLRWAKQTFDVTPGEFRLDRERCPKGVFPLEIVEGLQVSAIIYRPVCSSSKNFGDFARWKALHHPKLPEEKRARWTIKGGELRAQGGPGCLEFQEETFGDFALQLEVRTALQYANGGVFFRSIPGSFMNGYEAQIYNRCQDGDVSRPRKWATGAIDDRVNARRLISRDGVWFHYTILAQGEHMATWVNGYQTVYFHDTRKEHENPRQGKRVAPGTIQIQAHDGATDLSIRGVRIGKWD